MTDDKPFDPRAEADAQIARALQIVNDASESEDIDGNVETARRDYNPAELETLFFALGCAMVQLKKLPGGKEARDRFYDNATESLRIRGRRDLLDEVDAQAKLHRISDALDKLSVPRLLPGDDSTGAAEQELDTFDRVKWLADDYAHYRAMAAKPDWFRRSTDGELREEAVKVIKRTYGDNVDLGPGTTGEALVCLTMVEMRDLEDKRERLLEFATALRKP
jgi:hypothetical protein